VQQKVVRAELERGNGGLARLIPGEQDDGQGVVGGAELAEGIEGGRPRKIRSEHDRSVR
jgi:hypothetical protein